MNTATLTSISEHRSALYGTVYGLICSCDRCGRSNTHGGGTDPTRLREALGHRASHCRCPGGYHIVDPQDVIGRRNADQ